MHLSRRRLLALAGGAATWSALAPRPSAIARAEAEAEADAIALDRFRALCLQVARDNVVDGRPIPSQAYSQGTWMRDAFWTMAALGDRPLQLQTWKRFAATQDPATGQVPTALLNADTVRSVFDDESTAFFILLSLDLKRAGALLERAPIERAARYLFQKTAPLGRVQAGPGNYTWWLDTLNLARVDTVAYSQGVTAAAVRALRELGVTAEPGLADRVEAAYAGLYQPGLAAMTLSAGTTLLDVSCLVGEHLSLHFFRRSVLSDDAVAGTVRAFRPVPYSDGTFLGFPIATTLDGSFLPEAWFSPAPDNWPGHYHNGGSWLLYDAIALDTARRHGVLEAADLLRARIAAETRFGDTLSEYIATDPEASDFGQTPFAWRTGYAWNSYVGTLV